MINVHLALDEKFINASVDMFEKYYPGENYFIIDKNEKDRRFVSLRDNVFFIPFKQSNWLNRIVECCHFQPTDKFNVIVHYLSRHSANRALSLKHHACVNKICWIFYGADLYVYLNETGKYALYDYKVEGWISQLKRKIKLWLGYYNYVEKFCAELDYFCFWNYYDYKLLCKYVKTNAQFKFFYYINSTSNASSYDNMKLSESKQNIFLINHSASFTGNHVTILKKLSSLSIDDIKLIIPISYGPKEHADLIEKEAMKLFPNKYILLKDYMPRNEYYSIVDKCQCAIMGHRRQEAGGNISFLLLHGKKVFLREDNSLLQYYKNLGCFVYSFEKDLNSKEDLKPLTKEQQEINRKILLERISPQKIDDMMLNLFK